MYVFARFKNKNQIKNIFLTNSSEVRVCETCKKFMKPVEADGEAD